METTHNLTSCVGDLLDGKEVLCRKCGKGHYHPFNPKFPAKENHDFVCDNCGANIHWDPPIDID